jgi:hypothetical protein
MTRLRVLVSVGACAALCMVAVPAHSAQEPSPTAPATIETPAHVSVVEGAVVLERDGEADAAPANMPLLAGDRLRTREGRAEILFSDGGTLHLDAHTTVDFQSDELVRLLEGRVRLSIPGPLRAVSYRVDAPAGWAQITQPGEYRISMTRTARGEELELAVLRGGAELATDGGRTPLRAGERAFATPQTAPSYAYVFNSASWDDFDRWSESLRDRRLGASTQYLPEEVRPYAASFSQYGTWRHDVSHGYVWYPSVATDWRPYYRGRWVTMRPYGWTWIGADPWAWPTHHYGRWGFSAGLWFWIPGRTWGPAWVSWAYATDYVAWCPLGWNNRPLIQVNLFTGYGRWHPWTYVRRPHFGYGYVHHRAVRYHDIDARVRGSFAGRYTAPEFRGYAVPRATTPIRAAGARVGRAVPRGGAGSTVYTNLERGTSRVGQDGRRVMVPPSRSAPADSRTAPRDTTGPGVERSRAVPRAGVESPRPGAARAGIAPTQGDVRSTPGTARPRYAPSAPGMTRAPEARSGAPVDDGRSRMRAAPRAESPEFAPTRRAVPRGGLDTGVAPGARATPSAPYGPPSYGRPVERRGYDPGPPAGVRAAPRGSSSGSGSAPSAPGRIERRAPTPSRPSGPGASAPSPRGSGEAGSRPRGSSQPSRGRAVPRGGGD